MIAIILALLLHPAPPPFTAHWDAPGRATLRWSQSSRSCLYRESVIGERAFIGCFDGSGAAVLALGDTGPLDAAYRPTAGDVFVLDGPEGVRRARLRGVVYLAWMGR